MKILAYDTSGEVLSVALAVDGRALAEDQSAPGLRHSSCLMPLIEGILKKAGWKPRDLDVLAVGVGPGSFTGLRVGVATAKMLAFVWKTKLVGISSLEALARSTGSCAVAVDARRGRVYGALYEKRTGRLCELLAPSLMASGDFFAKAGGPVSVLDRPAVSAWAVAEAAYERAKAKRFATPDGLEPLYLHPKDCHVTQKPVRLG